MRFLAFEDLRNRSVYSSIQWCLAILPIGLMFASFAPSLYFAEKLSDYLDIGMNEPMRDHPNGWIWFVGFMATFLVLMILGYIAGWVLNAAILAIWKRWPKEKLIAVFCHSRLPSEWLRDGKDAKETAKLNWSDWEKERAKGFIRYIVARGSLTWGLLMFGMTYLPSQLQSDTLIVWSELLVRLAIWLVAGAVFGAFMWWQSERSYKRARSERE